MDHQFGNFLILLIKESNCDEEQFVLICVIKPLGRKTTAAKFIPKSIKTDTSNISVVIDCSQ